MIVINLEREFSYYREFEIIPRRINRFHLSQHSTLLIYRIPGTFFAVLSSISAIYRLQFSKLFVYCFTKK